MLIADLNVGLIGGSGIVGGMLPVAVGYAFAFQVLSSDRVVVCFFGDGAANQGSFNEAMNLAALWKLPVVFVCENNHYGLTVPLREHLAGSISGRADGYGIPGVTIDGNDVIEVYRATANAVERAREGGGPSLIEAVTYRMTGFSTGDQGGYQPDEEMADWAPKDPLERFASRLAETESISTEALEALRRSAVGHVRDACAFAEASAFPSSESVLEDVLAED
jgi:pyruvate dehydrogenase E1 component alpha subunit